MENFTLSCTSKLAAEKRHATSYYYQVFNGFSY